MAETQPNQQQPGNIPNPGTPSEPVLDLSFTRSQRDMIYVALVVSFLALGLSIALFVSSKNVFSDTDRTAADLRAEVGQKLAAVDEQVKTRLDQMQDELTAGARQAIAGMEGRVKSLESRLEEAAQLPEQVRSSLKHELVLDLKRRTQLLSSQLQSAEDRATIARIQEMLKSLESDI